MSNEVKRYDPEELPREGHFARCAEMEESLDGSYVHHDDYAALEAECERLNRESQNLSDQLGRCDRERRSLAAELAAIRAAGGEQVEVVGYGFQHVDKGWLFSSKSYHEVNPCLEGFSLMTVTQHNRIVAAMAAELERAKEEVTRWHTLACNHSRAEDRLRAELEAARKQEPVAIANKGDCAFWVSWTEAGKPLRGPGIKLYALPPLAGKVVVPEWVPVSERLPEPGVTVMVFAPPQPGDYPGDVRISFDGICPESDGDYWVDHGEHYENYCMIAKGGADIEWHGPSEKAPYTHWMPLPAAPALLATPSMEVKP